MASFSLAIFQEMASSWIASRILLNLTISWLFLNILREDTLRRWRSTHEKDGGRHADESDEANAARSRFVHYKLKGRGHLTWISHLIYSWEVKSLDLEIKQHFAKA